MATIQVRVDDNMKIAADTLFSDLGLDTSTAVRMFISAAVEEDGMPFAVKRNGKRKLEARTYKAAENEAGIPSKDERREKLRSLYGSVDEQDILMVAESQQFGPESPKEWGLMDK